MGYEYTYGVCVRVCMLLAIGASAHIEVCVMSYMFLLMCFV